MSMHGIAARSLTDRFAWLFAGLCRAVGVDAHTRRMEAALAWAIWNRVRLLGERLIALAARVEAGRAARRRKSTPHPDPLAQGEREKAGGSGISLPRGFGWIRGVLPNTGQFAGVLAYFLGDPEVVALVGKAPQAGRILRALCHLLGVTVPEFLQRRAGCAVSAVAPPTPVPSPVEAEGEDTSHRPPPQSGEAANGADSAMLQPPLPRPTDAGAAQSAPTSPPRPLSWLENDAEAMRERVARWVARRTDAPGTLLPLGLSRSLEWPGTGPMRPNSKNRG
jgi:hypothetical protein